MEIPLSGFEKEQVNSLFGKTKSWCQSNPVAAGVVEMALGAALISYAISNGLVDESVHAIKALSDPLFNNASKIGAAVGGGVGYIAGSIIGSIGVVALGGAIGIPAIVVAGGASLILGLAGYTAGDILHNIANTIDYPALALNGSVFLIGLGLLIDGARRCLSSEKVQAHIANIKSGVILLSEVTVEVAAETTQQILQLAKVGLHNVHPIAKDVSVGLAVGSIVLAAGGTISAGTTTVLGSSALGSLAIGLGLINPITLPVVGSAVVCAAGAVLMKRKFWQ